MKLFSWRPLLSLEREGKVRRPLLTSSMKYEIRLFSRRSRAVTAKKGTKKSDARAKLLFCQSNPFLFFDVLVTVAVVVAKAR